MAGHPPALSGSPAVAAVDAVIHRALEKRADDRFPSAEAMARALRAALSASGGSTPPDVRPATRLAVLPFRLLRADTDVDFLAFGLADAIVSSLAGLQSLVVRSSHAGARYTSDAPDLRAIAAELGVDAVICGTLLQAGSRVRVTAQLLAAPAGTVLWSGVEQVAMGNLFELQDHLARAVVESLSIPLSTREQKRLGRDLPTNARAYELYLRANQLSHSPELLAAAQRLYRSALEEDPNYAPAWAKLGRVYRLLAKYGVDDAATNLQRAEDAFARALAIDPDLSAAHNLYTYFEVETLGRSKEAMARLVARLQADGASADLFAGLVLACRYCGLLEASLAADRQARRLDPTIRTSVAYTYFMLADWTSAMAHDTDDVRWIANWCLPMLGRDDEAIAAYAEVGQRPLPALMGRLATACRLALQGERAQCLELAVSFDSRGFDPEGLYLAARALIRVREYDAAVRMIERAVERGFFCAAAFVRDPWLDPVRTMPGFARVLRAADERSRDAEAELRRLDGHRLLRI
jgi:TolB-like protein